MNFDEWWGKRKWEIGYDKDNAAKEAWNAALEEGRKQGLEEAAKMAKTSEFDELNGVSSKIHALINETPEGEK